MIDTCTYIAVTSLTVGIANIRCDLILGFGVSASH